MRVGGERRRASCTAIGVAPLSKRAAALSASSSSSSSWGVVVLTMTVLASVVLHASVVHAVPLTWCGADDADWSVPANWQRTSCGDYGVPTASDDVAIGGGKRVSFDGGSAQCASLTLGAGATLSTSTGASLSVTTLVANAAGSAATVRVTTGTISLALGATHSASGGTLVLSVTTGQVNIPAGGLNGAGTIVLQQTGATGGTATFRNMGPNGGPGTLVFDCDSTCSVQMSNTIGRPTRLIGGGDMVLTGNGLIWNSAMSVEWNGLRSLTAPTAVDWGQLTVATPARIETTSYIRGQNGVYLNAPLTLATNYPAGSGNAVAISGTLYNAGHLTINNTGGANAQISVSIPSTSATVGTGGYVQFVGSGAAGNQINWVIASGTFPRELRINCTLLVWSGADLNVGANNIQLSACAASAGQLIGSPGLNLVSTGVVYSVGGPTTNQVYVRTTGTMNVGSTVVSAYNVLEYRSDGGLLTPGAITGAGAFADINFRSDASLGGTGITVSIPNAPNNIRLMTFHSGVVYWSSFPSAPISTTLRVTGGATLYTAGPEVYVSAFAVHQNSVLIGAANQNLRAISCYCSDGTGTIRATGSGTIIIGTSGTAAMSGCQRLILEQATENPSIDLGTTLTGSGDVELRLNKAGVTMAFAPTVTIADGGRLWFSGMGMLSTTFNFPVPAGWTGRAVGVNSASLVFSSNSLLNVRNLTLIDGRISPGNAALALGVLDRCECLGSTAGGCEIAVGASAPQGLQCGRLLPLHTGTGAFTVNAQGAVPVVLGEIVGGPGAVALMATGVNTPLTTGPVHASGGQLRMTTMSSGWFQWSVPSGTVGRPLQVGQQLRVFGANSLVVPSLEFVGGGGLQSATSGQSVTATTNGCSVTGTASAQVALLGTGTLQCLGTGLYQASSTLLVLNVASAGSVVLATAICTGSTTRMINTGAAGTMLPVTLSNAGAFGILQLQTGVAMTVLGTGSLTTATATAFTGDVSILLSGGLSISFSGATFTLTNSRLVITHSTASGGTGVGISASSVTVNGACSMDVRFVIPTATTRSFGVGAFSAPPDYLAVSASGAGSAVVTIASTLASRLLLNGTISIPGGTPQTGLIDLVLGDSAVVTMGAPLTTSRLLSYGANNRLSLTGHNLTLTTGGPTGGVQSYGGVLTLSVVADRFIVPRDLSGDGAVAFEIASALPATVDLAGSTVAATLQSVAFRALSTGTLQLLAPTGFPCSVEIAGPVQVYSHALTLNNPGGSAPRVNLTLSGDATTVLRSALDVRLNGGANLRCVGTGAHGVALTGTATLQIAVGGAVDLSMNYALQVQGGSGTPWNLQAVVSTAGFTPSLSWQVTSMSAGLNLLRVTSQLHTLVLSNSGTGESTVTLSGALAVDVLQVRNAQLLALSATDVVVRDTLLCGAGVGILLSGTAVLAVGTGIRETEVSDTRFTTDSLSVGASGVAVTALQIGPAVESVVVYNTGPLVVGNSCVFNTVAYTGAGPFTVGTNGLVMQGGPGSITITAPNANVTAAQLSLTSIDVVNMTTHSGSFGFGVVAASAGLSLRVTDPAAVTRVNVSVVSTLALLRLVVPPNGDWLCALPQNMATALFVTSGGGVAPNNGVVRLLGTSQSVLTSVDVRGGVTLRSDARLATTGACALSDDSSVVVLGGGLACGTTRVGAGANNVWRVSGTFALGTNVQFPSGAQPLNVRSIAGRPACRVEFPTNGASLTSVVLWNDEGLNGAAGPLLVRPPSTFSAGTSVQLAGAVAYVDRAWFQTGTGVLNFTTLAGGSGASLAGTDASYSLTASGVSVHALGGPGVVHTLATYGDSSATFGVLRLAPGVTMHVQGTSGVVSLSEVNFNGAGGVVDLSADDAATGAWSDTVPGATLVVSRLKAVNVYGTFTVHTLNVTGALVRTRDTNGADVLVRRLTLTGLDAPAWAAELATDTGGRSVVVAQDFWSSGATGVYTAAGAAGGNVQIGGDAWLVTTGVFAPLTIVTSERVVFGGSVRDVYGLGSVVVQNARGSAVRTDVRVAGPVMSCSQLALTNVTYTQLTGHMVASDVYVHGAVTLNVSAGSLRGAMHAGESNATLAVHVGGTGVQFPTVTSANPDDGFPVAVHFAGAATSVSLDASTATPTEIVNLVVTTALPTTTVNMEAAADLHWGVGLGGGGTLVLGVEPQTQLRSLWLSGGSTLTAYNHVILTRGACTYGGPAGSRATVQLSSGAYNLSCPATYIASGVQVVLQVDGPGAAILPGSMTGDGPGRTADVVFAASATPATVLFGPADSVVNVRTVTFRNGASTVGAPPLAVHPPAAFAPAMTVVVSGALRVHTRAWTGGASLNFTAALGAAGAVSTLTLATDLALSVRRTCVEAGTSAAVTVSGGTGSFTTNVAGIVLAPGAQLNVSVGGGGASLGDVAGAVGGGTGLLVRSSDSAYVSADGVRVHRLVLDAATLPLTFVHAGNAVVDSTLTLLGNTVTCQGLASASMTVATFEVLANAAALWLAGSGVLSAGSTYVAAGTLELHSDARPMALGAVTLASVTPPALQLVSETAGAVAVVTASTLTGALASLTLNSATLQVLSGAVVSAACAVYGTSGVSVTGASGVTCGPTSVNTAAASFGISSGSGSIWLGAVTGAGSLVFACTVSAVLNTGTVSGTEGAFVFNGPAITTWNGVPTAMQRPLVIGSARLSIGSGAPLTSLAYLNLTGTNAQLVSSGPSVGTVSAAQGGACRVLASSGGGAGIYQSTSGSIACGSTVIDGADLLVYTGGAPIALGDVTGTGALTVSGGGANVAFSTGSISASGAALKFVNWGRVTWAVPATGCPRPLTVQSARLYVSGGSLVGLANLALAPGSIVSTASGTDLNVTVSGGCTISGAAVSFVNLTQASVFSCASTVVNGADTLLSVRVETGGYQPGSGIVGTGSVLLDSARPAAFATPLQLHTTGAVSVARLRLLFSGDASVAGPGSGIDWRVGAGSTVSSAIDTFGVALAFAAHPPGSRARLTGPVTVGGPSVDLNSGMNVSSTFGGGASATVRALDDVVLRSGWGATGALSFVLSECTVQATGAVTTSGALVFVNTVHIAPLPGTGGVLLPNVQMSSDARIRVTSPSSASQPIVLSGVSMPAAAGGTLELGGASAVSLVGAAGAIGCQVVFTSSSTSLTVSGPGVVLAAPLAFGGTSAALALDNGATMQGSTIVVASGAPRLTLGANTRISATPLGPVPFVVTVTGNATTDAFGPFASVALDANAFLHFTGLASVNPPLTALAVAAPAGLLYTGPVTGGLDTVNISTSSLTTVFGAGARTVHFSRVAVQVLAASGSAWTIDLQPGAQPATVSFRNNATAYVQNGGARVTCAACPSAGADASSTSLVVSSDSLPLLQIDGTTPFDFSAQTAVRTQSTINACLYTPRAPTTPTNVAVNASPLCSYGFAVGCQSNPCSAAGTAQCVTLAPPAPFGAYRCDCLAGYSGTRCQTDVNECASNPCPGPCVDGVNGYTCVASPCVSSPCGNGGTCVDTSVPGAVSSYTCTCPTYWTGAQCGTWVDPCTVEKCYYGKVCRIDAPLATSYQCVCGADNCGAATPAAAAEEAALSRAVVPTFVALSPSSVTATGGTELTLITQGFTGAVTVQFALYANSSTTTGTSGTASSSSTLFSSFGHASYDSGRFATQATTRGAVTLALTPPVVPNTTEDVAAERYLRQLRHTFRALPYAITKSAYRTLVLTVTPDDGGAAYQLSDSGALYYPFNPCLNANELLAFTSAGVPYCTGCPAGGFCPGGGRVWPRAGYWSTSEFATPVACQLPSACPGANGDVAGYAPLNNRDGSRYTSVCAEGYQGFGCSQCAPSFFQQGLRCHPCGATDSDAQQLRFLIAAAVIVFAALTVAVASLSSRHLAIIVSGLLSLQQFVVIGKSSSQQLPESLNWLGELISFLSVINFDVQMVKPGCIVPQLAFLDLYWATLVLVFAFALLFVVGAALRATWVYHFRLKNRVQFLRAESDDLQAATDMAQGDGGATGAVELAPSVPLVSPGGGAATAGAAVADPFQAPGTPVIRAGVGPGGHSRHHSEAHSVTTAALTRGATSANVHTHVSEETGAGAAGRRPSPVVAAFARLSEPAAAGGGVASPTDGGRRRDSPVISPLAALLGPGANSSVKPPTPPTTSAGSRVGRDAAAAVVVVKPIAVAPAAASAGAVVLDDGDEDDDERAAAEAAALGSTDERDWAKTWCDVFAARTALSLLILGSIVFLKVFTLLLNCAYCTTQHGATSDDTQTSGSTRLVVDMQIECYVGAHLPAVVVNYVLLVLYGLGFPVLSGVLLYRAFHSPQLSRPLGQRARDEIAASADPEHTTKRLLRERQHRYDAKRADYYGYMFRGLLPTAYYFRLTTFVTNWGFALQQVFTSSVSIQLFVPGVFFLLNMTGTAYLWPYLHNWNNVLSVGVGFGGVGQVLVYLGLLSRDGSANTNHATDTTAAIKIFLYWMSALALLSIAFVVAYRVHQRRQAAKLRAAAKRAAADAVHAARLRADAQHAADVAAAAARARSPSNAVPLSVVSPPAGSVAHSRKPSSVMSPGGVGSPVVGGRLSLAAGAGASSGPAAAAAGDADDDFSPHHPAGRAGAAPDWPTTATTTGTATGSTDAAGVGGGIAFAPSTRGARVSGTAGVRPPPLQTGSPAASDASNFGHSPVVRPPRTPPNVTRTDRVSPHARSPSVATAARVGLLAPIAAPSDDAGASALAAVAAAAAAAASSPAAAAEGRPALPPGAALVVSPTEAGAPPRVVLSGAEAMAYIQRAQNEA